MVFPPRTNPTHISSRYLPPNQQMGATPFPIQNTGQTKSSISVLATKGINGLSKTLTNVQQVLKVVQTTAPLIEQYAPLVKNLPAMYKMLKAMKDFNDTDEEELGDYSSEEETNEDDNSHQVDALSMSDDEESIDTIDEDTSIKSKYKKDGVSTPKLFI